MDLMTIDFNISAKKKQFEIANAKMQKHRQIIKGFTQYLYTRENIYELHFQKNNNIEICDIFYKIQTNYSIF